MPWAELVERAAAAAVAGFEALASRFDSIAVGREWPEAMEFEAAGG